MTLFEVTIYIIVPLGGFNALATDCESTSLSFEHQSLWPQYIKRCAIF